VPDEVRETRDLQVEAIRRQRMRVRRDEPEEYNDVDLLLTVLQERGHAEEAVREGLLTLRRQVERHLIVDEDCWYSCPLAAYADTGEPACCNDRAVERGECTCGAEAKVATVDALLAALRRGGAPGA